MTSHSFLTVMSPIEYRHDDPDGNIAAIRQTLLAHEQDESPFQDCGMVHMARLQIIDQVTPPMGDISGEGLKSRYLLFVVDLDGSVDDFLDCFYRKHGDFVHAVWGRCLGYPAYKGAVFFRRYVNRCLFKKPLAYAGFPVSVEDTLRALTRKQNLAEWVASHQGLSDAALQAAWKRDRMQFVKPNLPKPGQL